MNQSELTEKIKNLPRELHTARTRLVAPTLNLVDVRIEAIRASYEALEFIPGWRLCLDREVATRSIERDVKISDSGEEAIYNVFETTSQAFVGRIDLHTWDADAPRCEIGYWADTRLGGRGLLLEAAKACVELAFLIGAARVQAVTDTRNVKSIQFAKALGMQEEGVLRQYERLNGVLCDQIILSICNTEPRK
jgi:RimJ/RimL family protein N-acetyltransferase